METSDFSWDVHIPGEDLPRRLQTTYLLSAGEEVVVDGDTWVVESVEAIEDDEGMVTGRVVVGPPHGPRLVPPSP